MEVGSVECERDHHQQQPLQLEADEGDEEEKAPAHRRKDQTHPEDSNFASVVSVHLRLVLMTSQQIRKLACAKKIISYPRLIDPV